MTPASDAPVAAPDRTSDLPGVTLGFLLVQVVLPIVIGGMIYICWRVDHLFMFTWFDAIGLTPLIEWFREVAGPARPYLPDWLLYSVPDGTWVYACVAFFGRLWRDGPWWATALWTGMGPAMAIGGELGQIPGWVPGTWDWVDFVWYVACAVIAFAFAWWPMTTWPDLLRRWTGGSSDPSAGEAPTA